MLWLLAIAAACARPCNYLQLIYQRGNSLIEVMVPSALAHGSCHRLSDCPQRKVRFSVKDGQLEFRLITGYFVARVDTRGEANGKDQVSIGRRRCQFIAPPLLHGGVEIV